MPVRQEVSLPTVMGAAEIGDAKEFSADPNQGQNIEGGGPCVGSPCRPCGGPPPKCAPQPPRPRCGMVEGGV